LTDTAAQARNPTVTFARSKKTVPWDDKFSNLLEFAEAQGLKPDFSCRAGVCRTCECELLSGNLAYDPEPLDAPEEGMAFICCSKPDGDVSLNI
jgi:ferredoxin